MLAHPATPSCDSCKSWLYDTKTGEWTRDRRGQRVPRLNVPVPCESCPRKAPEREAETTLSEKNCRAYVFALEVRAMGAECLSERQRRDPLTRRIVTIVDMVVSEHRHGELIQAVQMSQLALLNR